MVLPFASGRGLLMSVNNVTDFLREVNLFEFVPQQPLLAVVTTSI